MFWLVTFLTNLGPFWFVADLSKDFGLGCFTNFCDSFDNFSAILTYSCFDQPHWLWPFGLIYMSVLTSCFTSLGPFWNPEEWPWPSFVLQSIESVLQSLLSPMGPPLKIAVPKSSHKSSALGLKFDQLERHRQVSPQVFRLLWSVCALWYRKMPDKRQSWVSTELCTHNRSSPTNLNKIWSFPENSTKHSV